MPSARNILLARNSRRWRAKHPGQYRASQLALLGGKCARCGVTDHRVLDVNHVNGGGTKEAKRFGGRYRGNKFYCAILDGRRTTTDLNLLCRPCNLIDHVERVFPDLKGAAHVVWTIREVKPCPPVTLTLP